MCKKYSVQCPAACGVKVPREKVCFFVCYASNLSCFQESHKKCKAELVTFL